MSRITSAMWDAYAEAAYKLTGTQPTELERAGMEAAYEVLADFHARAIMHVMQLDQLNRLHIERTRLKQHLRREEDTVKRLSAYIDNAAGPVTMLMPISTMEEITARLDRLVGALRRLANPVDDDLLIPVAQIAAEALGESDSSL